MLLFYWINSNFSDLGRKLKELNEELFDVWVYQEKYIQILQWDGRDISLELFASVCRESLLILKGI